MSNIIVTMTWVRGGSTFTQTEELNVERALGKLYDRYDIGFSNADAREALDRMIEHLKTCTPRVLNEIYKENANG